MVKRTQATVLSIVLFASVLIAAVSCDRENEAAASPEPEPVVPEVSLAQAERALGDVMLASSVSLLLAFSAEPGQMETGTEDGSVKLAWDESADFSTGIGVYTITFTDYDIPSDNPFGLNYNGYVLSGTVVMGSQDAVSTRMEIDVEVVHADSEINPVQSIVVSLEGYQDSPTANPTGQILINGREMEFRDLTGAFVIGE